MGSSEERVVAVIMVGGPTKGMALYRKSEEFWVDGNHETLFSVCFEFVDSFCN